MKRLLMILKRNVIYLPDIIFRLFWYSRKNDRHSKQEKYNFIRKISYKAINKGNLLVKVYGSSNLPEENGFIFYPNHQGVFDGFAIVYACDIPFSPVIKKELMDKSIVKKTFACLESLPMNRQDIRQSMKIINEVANRVKRKENCLIFAEGTRSNSNNLNEFKAGSFKAAYKSKCPIIPVALINSFLPFDENNDEPVIVQVHFLKPIYYDEYCNKKTNEIAMMVQQQIQTVINDYS